MLIAKLIVTLGILSLCVWIYQSIILPSIRQKLRFELFDLRDDLRELVISRRIREGSGIFQKLHRRLNAQIKAVPKMDIVVIIKIEEERPELEVQARKFKELVEDSIPEVESIYHRALGILALTLFANSFFWFLPMLLAVIPIAVTQGVWAACRDFSVRMKARAVKAFEVKESEIEAFSPLPAFTVYG